MKKCLCLLLSAALCLGLFAFPAAAGDALPESAHPYEKNCEKIWEYTYPEETDRFFLTFSTDSFLAPGAVVYMDENGETVTLTLREINEMMEAAQSDPEKAQQAEAFFNNASFVDVLSSDTLTLEAGEEVLEIFRADDPAGRTVYVPGRIVRLRLTAFNNEDAYGFRVTRVSRTPPEDVRTVSYYLDKAIPAAVKCLRAGETDYVEDCTCLLLDDKACIGWSTVPGGDVVYQGNEEIAVNENLSLYAVFTPLLLRPDEVFSFDNELDVFGVNKLSFSYDGIETLAFSDYYMEEADFLALLKNFSRTLGATPLGLAAVRDALLSRAFPWDSSAWGLAMAVALQHYGLLDLRALQPGAETVRDLESAPALISAINYYEWQETPAYALMTAANFPGSPWYRAQLKKLYETVAGGDLALLNVHALHTFDSVGSPVLLTAAYDDADGNHVLLAYDPDWSSEYADGFAFGRFYISPDFTEISSDAYWITGFEWLGDFSGFTAFAKDGTGDSATWYRSVLNHIKTFLETARELLTAFAAR